MKIYIFCDSKLHNSKHVYLKFDLLNLKKEKTESLCNGKLKSAIGKYLVINYQFFSRHQNIISCHGRIQ